jgi:hypothetical protein
MELQYIEKIKGDYEHYYKDRRMTILHRSDGPAIECADGHKEWWVNGQPHRSDGPAIEYSDKSKFWYVYGKCHREDGPAVEKANGDKEWWIDGKFIKSIKA